jgi:hypothetical protein
VKVVFVRIREKEFREDFILYIYTYIYIYTHITYITQEMHRFYRSTYNANDIYDLPALPGPGSLRGALGGSGQGMAKPA